MCTKKYLFKLIHHFLNLHIMPAFNDNHGKIKIQTSLKDINESKKFHSMLYE